MAAANPPGPRYDAALLRALTPDPVKLAYYVHGRGRGHASRALSIVPALREARHDVTLFGARDALPMLAALGPVEKRPLLRPGLSGLVALLQRALREKRALREAGRQLVVSDGDQAALLAAHWLGLPSLAIGHDLVFARCAVPVTLSAHRLLHQRVNALIPSRLSTRRVAVHFLPCRSSDVGTRVARPLMIQAEHAHDAPVRARSRALVCYFRDGNGQAALRHARAICPHVIHRDGQSEGHYDRETFQRLLAESAGVIGSAGSNLIAECVLLGTPLLALYRESDPEQALNAQWLAAAGAGMACSFERLDAATVADFWQRACAQQFVRVELAQSLPSTVDAVLASLDELADTFANRHQPGNRL